VWGVAASFVAASLGLSRRVATDRPLSLVQCVSMIFPLFAPESQVEVLGRGPHGKSLLDMGQHSLCFPLYVVGRADVDYLSVVVALAVGQHSLCFPLYVVERVDVDYWAVVVALAVGQHSLCFPLYVVGRVDVDWWAVVVVVAPTVDGMYMSGQHPGSF
jgi:hypothetical protein